MCEVYACSTNCLFRWKISLNLVDFVSLSGSTVVIVYNILYMQVPGLYNGSSLSHVVRGTSFNDSELYITTNKMGTGARGVPENNLLRSFSADKEKATNVAKIKVVVCPFALVLYFLSGLSFQNKEVIN